MKINVSAVVKVNSATYASKIQNDSAFWRFAATEWHKLYSPYVPMYSGMLDNTISIEPGEIVHTVPYARRMYYGEKINFNKGFHPRASAKWDQKAEATQKPKLISALQAYVNSGRINFND